MKLARGEHRNSTGSTTSASVPNRLGRDQLDERRALVRVLGEIAAGQLGVHVARRHRVRGDPVLGVLVGDDPHQLVDRALGRRVGAVVLVAAAPGDRGEEEDPPARLRLHAGERFGRGVERARQVDDDDPVPVAAS